MAVVFAFLTLDSAVIASPPFSPRLSDLSGIRLAAAATTASEHIVVHLDPRASTSIRENYLHVSILELLLRGSASRSIGVRQCGTNVRKDVHFQFFEVSVAHAESARRIECLRGIVDYLLRAAIPERQFISARNASAFFTGLWTSSSHEGLAVSASERLAYLAIYEPGTPLHQLYSVDDRVIRDVSLGSFLAWLHRIREQELVTFGGSSELLSLLGDLTAADATSPSISFASGRSRSGEYTFDGQRFGVPALIMVAIDPGYADGPIGKDPIWSRFNCNRRGMISDGGYQRSIARIDCFSHHRFGTDTWLGLAIRQSAGSGDRGFCGHVRALANDQDVTALFRRAPNERRGLYVMLPAKCEINL